MFLSISWFLLIFLSISNSIWDQLDRGAPSSPWLPCSRLPNSRKSHPDFSLMDLDNFSIKNLNFLSFGRVGALFLAAQVESGLGC